MPAASSAQVRAIHALRSRAGLDEGDYRAFLEREAGVTTSKALTQGAAIRVIDRLKALAGQKTEGAMELSGPYAGICRALWISAWNLGIVAHREDTALVAFVRRQTKLDHMRWLRDHEDARKVIEALKDWMAREAGVQWPKQARARLPNGSYLDLRKHAVVRAQYRLLGEARRIPADADLDALMAELGVRVRKLRAAR